MRRIVWTPVAESDLDNILFYIALVGRNVAVGERIFHELRSFLTEQAEKRLSGHRHADAPDDWLYCKYKRWLIFYRPLADGVEVMRVVDAVRDLPRELRGPQT